MTTKIKSIIVAGIKVEVVRKDIKNLHLGVYPPQGRVRVAAPLVLSDEAVRLAVIDKLAWIKRHKVKFEEQPRQSKRQMVNGESHYYLGRRYRLQVHEQNGPARVALRGMTKLEIFVRPVMSIEQREAVLLRWYRQQLKRLIPPMLEKWQPILDVQVDDWGVRKMKTKWGSCNPAEQRIWVNLELAKKNVHCLEYIVVHEMVHMLERHHNERFMSLMDQFMPQWRVYREELKQGPLGHENWDY